MKKILFIAVLCVLPFIAIAQTPYFCTKSGSKQLRGSYDASEKLVMYMQQEVTDVKQDGNTITVVIHTTALNPDKSQFPYILPFDTTYEIRDGDVYMVLGAEDAETINLGEVSIPADMKVGDDYGGGEFEILTSGIANKAIINYRKVVGEETITTPAGSFDCMIYEQMSEVKVLEIKQKGITKTWYAKGVGDVKSESYTVKGKLRSRTLLEEL